MVLTKKATTFDALEYCIFINNGKQRATVTCDASCLHCPVDEILEPQKKKNPRKPDIMYLAIIDVKDYHKFRNSTNIPIENNKYE